MVFGPSGRHRGFEAGRTRIGSGSYRALGLLRGGRSVGVRGGGGEASGEDGGGAGRRDRFETSLVGTVDRVRHGPALAVRDGGRSGDGPRPLWVGEPLFKMAGRTRVWARNLVLGSRQDDPIQQCAKDFVASSPKILRTTNAPVERRSAALVVQGHACRSKPHPREAGADVGDAERLSPRALWAGTARRPGGSSENRK